MPYSLKLIRSDYFQQYANFAKIDGRKISYKLHKKLLEAKDFEFYLLSSSLYSSKIEGNSLDANSLMRNRNSKIVRTRKEYLEIENLAKAYNFALSNPLNKKNFLEAHRIFSQTLLPKSMRGKFRQEQVAVYNTLTLQISYLPVETEFVEQEIDKLFDDIEILIRSKLTYKEIFYYASMMHLWIAFIHPFRDGNGRAARLLEKWFLSSKIGLSAWAINSEKYYWDYRSHYYQNIALGYNYFSLQWNRCMPFLLMLTNTVK